MKTIVCTLFENHYSTGVAALINSLYLHGFRGKFYAGYKGKLEGWADASLPDNCLEWSNARTLNLESDFQIHLIPITSEYHLANYKPYFMLELMKSPTIAADTVVYFDPDIVIKCKWNFFEKWFSYGVALVQEIANDPMPFTHPVRLGWNEVIEKCNRKINHQLYHYFNSGFCGVSKRNIEFLETWCEIINAGVLHFGYVATGFVSIHDRTYHFSSHDQDALNIAAMCSICPLSEVGPDGMDFAPGGWLMSHATGSPKPWKKKFIKAAINGNLPTRSDREFWNVASGKIKIFSGNQLKWKKIAMSLAGFIGRFYSRK